MIQNQRQPKQQYLFKDASYQSVSIHHPWCCTVRFLCSYLRNEGTTIGGGSSGSLCRSHLHASLLPFSIRRLRGSFLGFGGSFRGFGGRFLGISGAGFALLSSAFDSFFGDLLSSSFGSFLVSFLGLEDFGVGLRGRGFGFLGRVRAGRAGMLFKSLQSILACFLFICQPFSGGIRALGRLRALF
jgi:hypothetical protein